MSRASQFDLSCDAPSYHIVRACRGLGFQAPEDVRWFHMARYLRAAEDRAGSWYRPWKLLWMVHQPKAPTCTCGQRLPVLERYSFRTRSDNVFNYLLGQCGRCWTIYWEEA